MLPYYLVTAKPYHYANPLNPGMKESNLPLSVKSRVRYGYLTADKRH